MKTFEAISFVRVGLLLCLFSALMFFGSCPSWFFALLITVSLLQLSAWVFLKIHHPSQSLLSASPSLSRWNTAAQLAWAAALSAQLGIQLWSPWSFRLSAPIVDFVYCSLAALQILAFYRVFCQYRPLFLADFRHISSPAP